jgi:hypothetical protein
MKWDFSAFRDSCRPLIEALWERGNAVLEASGEYPPGFRDIAWEEDEN